MKPISSYFNPCSKRHDALTNFKQLSCLKQVGIGFVVSLVAIIFAPFAVPVFRLLNECCVVKKELDDADQRTRSIYKSRVQDLGALPPLEINLDNVNKPMQTAPKPTVSAIPEKAPAPSTTSSTTSTAVPTLEPEKALAPVGPLSTSSSTTSTAAPTLEPKKLEPKKAPAPVEPQKMIDIQKTYKFTKAAICTCLESAGLSDEDKNKIAEAIGEEAIFGSLITRRLSQCVYRAEEELLTKCGDDTVTIQYEIRRAESLIKARIERLSNLLAQVAVLVESE